MIYPTIDKHGDFIEMDLDSLTEKAENFLSEDGEYFRIEMLAVVNTLKDGSKRMASVRVLLSETFVAKFGTPTQFVEEFLRKHDRLTYLFSYATREKIG